MSGTLRFGVLWGEKSRDVTTSHIAPGCNLVTRYQGGNNARSTTSLTIANRQQKHRSCLLGTGRCAVLLEEPI